MVTSNIEKLLHVCQSGGKPVIRQAVEKHLTVALLRDPVIQKDQHAAIALAANQPAESLFQSDSRLRDLVIVERVPPRVANTLDARVDHRIVRHREWQFIYDNAAQLLARHIDSLPKGRGGEEHAV